MHNSSDFDHDFLLDLYGNNVIASLTDTKGIIKYVSDAYAKISEYSKEELLGKPQSIVRHPDMPSSIFQELWETISSGKTWKGEIKNLKKNKGFYWVKATVTPQKDHNGKIIGYASVRQDITDKKKAILLHNQIQTILNNIEDGFLTFDKNFKIQESYSKSCLNILQQDTINNKNITDILFDNDLEQKEAFTFGCEQLFKIDCSDTKDIYLSLLPHIHHINQVQFTINYKLLPNNNLLILLRDITNQRELESKVEYEQKMNKMLITIATHKKEAIELMESFKKFLNKDLIKMNKNKLKLKLHTFKGLFAQLEMIYSMESIHNLETILKNELFTNQHKINLKTAFNQDIKMISDIFGDSFLSVTTTVKIDVTKIDKIASNLQIAIDKNTNNKYELSQVLKSIKQMKNQSLFQMIKVHEITVSNIAKIKNKNILPLDIIGSKNILVDDAFKNFTKSLVHIFSNSIIHGIEESDIRKKYNKPIDGKIVCSFKRIENNIVFNISDNGQGLNKDEIIKKAIELKLTTKENVKKLTNQEILQFIFSNEFSMSKTVDEFSGRGMGLASVKYDLLGLNGNVHIDNNPNNGLAFIFTIPYKNQIVNDSRIIANTLVNTTKEFFNKELKITVNNTMSIKTINMEDCYSTIQLSGLKNVLFSIIFEKPLLDKTLEFFLQNKKEQNQFKENVTDEVLNIILGLSIPKFPHAYTQLRLGTPTVFDNLILESFIKDNQSTLIRIETEYGNFELSVIILNDIN